MTTPIRAVLVGCGGMAGAWLNAAKESGVELVGFVDLREEAARKRATESGAASPVIGTDMRTVIQQAKPDAVFDCTIPDAHFNVTMTALELGCHVLGEKPLADSLAHAREMVKAAQQAGKIYSVIQNYRYTPNIRRLKNFLGTGALGDMTTISSNFYIGAHFGGFRDKMKHVLLLDMAIHTFDASRFLSGADPVAVYCQEWNPQGSWYDHDASAIAMFEMSNGCRYTYHGSWCAEGLNTSWNSDWRFIGTKGSARWDGELGFQGEVISKTDGFRSEMKPIYWPAHEAVGKIGGHNGLMREFVECLHTGKTPETICSDNIKSLAMVFAAIESAETGKRVAVKV